MNEKLKVYAVVLKYPIGSLILISILNFCLLFIIIKLSNNLDTLKVLFINIIDLVGFSINFHHLFICASSFFTLIIGYLNNLNITGQMMLS